MWIRIFLPVAWATLIWWASSWQPSSGETGFWESYLHNGAHIGIFGVLAALIYLCIAEVLERPAVSALVLSALYGASDELHQMSVPGRHASLLDVISDCIGAALFLAALVWLRAGQALHRSLVLLLIPFALGSALLATLF